MSNKRLPLVFTASVLQCMAGVSVPAELPVPCAAGNCGAGVGGFVQSGQAGASVNGNTLRVDQQSARAVLNWQSFNIGADGKVQFRQPDASAIALNRIHQASPSQIFGALEANGQVYLINQNGFVFGAGSRTRTAGLLASTLNITDEAFNAGILASTQPVLRSDGRSSVLDAQGRAVLGADGQPLGIQILVQQGAEIATNAAGQRILLASRKVDNAGKLQADDGQVLLAAGEKVYLAASTDPQLRGLLVEVDSGGEAWNRLTGDISAARGNITIAGLAVNQQGRLSATTSVNANGSIRLQGRDTIAIRNSLPIATRGGTVELGAQSVTSVLPELADTTTAVDDQSQGTSRIDISGRQITLRGGSRIIAPGGNVNIAARIDPSQAALRDAQSRLRMEQGAVIDVSGSRATAPVSRNLVSVELRANELRDSPVQRDGPLRGQRVVVDARVGTPLGDVSGALATVPRTIAERTATGGTVTMSSQGDIVVASGARIDVSGGQVDYLGGVMQTTQLVRADGTLVDIGKADPAERYIGLVNPTYQTTYDRWGVVENRNGALLGRYQAGYTQGANAGTVQFIAPNMVLNGDFKGAVVNGQYQQTAATAARGGKFIIGAPEGLNLAAFDYGAPSVRLVTQAPDIAIDPAAPLPAGRTLELSTRLLDAGGFSDLRIFSNGTVTVPAATPLSLRPGGLLEVLANRIDIGADVTAAGGTIRLATDRTLQSVAGNTQPAAGIFIAPAVTLDASGLWNNDAMGTLRPQYRDAGSIDLAVRSHAINGIDVPTTLSLGDGVRLLANGGASRSATGAVTGGKGGGIALRAPLTGSAMNLGEGIDLQAFGVQGQKGGSFVLEAGRINLVDGDTWATAQSFHPADGAGATLRIGDALFSDHGFSSFDLNATGPGAPQNGNAALLVSSGARVDTRPQTLQLQGDLSRQASGGGIGAFSRRAQLDDALLLPSTLVLRTDSRAVAPGGIAGGLVMQAGSEILAQARSTISLSSPGGVFIGGSIRTASGTINVALPNPTLAVDQGYNASLGIELASTARLDTSGIVLLQPTEGPQRLGEVLAGGQVNLLADRGSILMRSGAVIDVSGTQGLLDQAATQSAAAITRQMVASAGGQVVLRAPESILLQGSLEAHAGTGGVLPAAGGSLSVQLTRDRGFVPQPGVGAAFPGAPRVLRVTPIPVAAGSLPSGSAIIEQQLVANSGIDSLELVGGDTVRFDAGVILSLGRQLLVDAPQIDIGAGDAVNLAASYVALGYTTASTRTQAAPLSGGGILKVQADQIELIGSTTLQHVATAELRSKGDLRLRGVESGGSSRGELDSAGNLTLAAARIYPATSTDYTIKLLGDETNTLNIEQNGRSPGTPLSAAGSLTLNADRIVQGGTLLAPFGKLNLTAAQSLELRDGSVTSVSGAGTTVPFGRVEVGTGWVYRGSTLVSTTPERAIDLQAPTVNMADGATVDLRGGGDLYAFSWLPGTGGSRDALAPGQIPGLYAIVPALAGGLAPYDPVEYTGSDLRPGSSVYLSGAAGLPAGNYMLLPARYALLPGAYLVRSVAGYAGLRPGMQSALPDGTPVVAGYMNFGGTGLGSGQYSAFAISRGEFARQLASYEDHFASSYLPAQTTRLDLGRLAIPADAGSFRINVGESLLGQADVLTAAAAGGRGAAIDIAARNLQIVGATPVAPATGVVQLNAATLREWNPASLLLGGTRSSTGAISVTADTVSFAGDASLTLAETIAAANSSVSMAAGTKLGALPASTAPGSGTLSLSGNAALLAVSRNANLDILRSNVTNTGGGTLRLAAGSTVESQGTVLIDAAAGGNLDGTIHGSGASWILGSRQLSFAQSPLASGFTLTPGLLSQMRSASSLTLRGSSSIDFNDSVDLSGIGRLALESSLLRATNPGTNVSLVADSVSLRGAAAALPALAAGNSSLSIQAGDVTLQAGNLGLSGFGNTRITATRGIVADGNQLLQTPGDIELSAARLSTSTGANASIVAGGAVRVLAAAGNATLPPAQGLGGALSISGNSVDVSGRIVMPSGYLALNAANRLSLLDGALLDTSGIAVAAAGRQVYSPGGEIKLTAGGGIDAAAGATLRVNGAGNTDAGRVVVQAGGTADIRSRLEGQAAVAARGAAFHLAAGNLASFGGLNTLLESGGFREQRSLHVQQGDLLLGAGNSITARRVELSTDTGTVRIAGTINAQGAESLRGGIELFGGQGAYLDAGGVLRTAATGSLGRGGDIILGSSQGSVGLAAGSRVDARGDVANGNLVLRAPALAGDVAVTAVAATLQGVDAVEIEPVVTRTVSTGTVDSTQLGAWLDEAQAFAIDNGAAIRTRLARSDNIPVLVGAGLELRRTGDLQLGSSTSPLDVDLMNWRADGQPVSLTVRATGSLTLNGLLSDGFELNFDSFLDDFAAQRSGTLRLAAGANLAAANPLAVVRDAAADFRIHDGVLRTGTGNLSVAAARDLIFSGTRASIYTGGLPATTSLDTGLGYMLSHGRDGGDLSLVAGRDIIGNSVTQDVGSWQIRQGLLDVNPLRWGVDVGSFRWNAGSLGGGDVVLTAGRDVREAAVAAADNAITTETDELLQARGGVLVVDAGRDVSSSMFHVTAGANRITAGGSLAGTRAGQGGTALGSLLSMQDARLDIAARGAISLESVFNPTVLAQRAMSGDFRSYFFTYGDQSALRLLSTTGNISAEADRDRIRAFVGNDSWNSNESLVFAIAPPNLAAHALSGDIDLFGTTQLVLYPSSSGQLDLFAARDLAARLQMSDASLASLPTLRNPASNTVGVERVTSRIGGALHLQDPVAAEITAGRNILASYVGLAKFGNVAAGLDIVDLNFSGQNLRAGDDTVLTAGRDIRFTRSATNAGITLGGPGQFDLLAGRDVDLGFSTGITTTGRLANPAIPTDGGAAINLFAGLARPLDVAAFLDKVVEASQPHQAALIGYVTGELQQPAGSYAEAKAAFLAAGANQQRPFVTKVFFQELVKAGRDANTDPTTNFARGYAAIDALLPGSRNADARDDWVNPYDGDLRLAFSRIYTLDGGDINLFIPGGGIDVGLAVPPVGAPARKPSELGIVAQRAGAVRAFASDNVLVNSSRVFTLTGGDITIWSTAGDIDAGRGAKSSISAPAPTLLVSADGSVRVDFAGAVAGSGIRSILTDPSVKAGDVDLIAPTGIVNAGDAGIGAAGNLNVAAQQVVGLDNIQVGGSSSGVPAETSNLGAALSGVSASSTSAAASAGSTMDQEATASTTAAPLAETALGWLDVFIDGFGAESCKSNDAECLERNRKQL